MAEEKMTEAEHAERLLRDTDEYFATIRQRRTDDVDPDVLRRADHRHEHLMKMLSMLETSVLDLSDRLEVVLTPERPQPTNGEPSDPEMRNNYSIIEQRHRTYMQALDDITRRVQALVERVDL